MSDQVIRELSLSGKVSGNFPLSSVTTFRTGGAADYLFEPESEESAAKALSILSGEKIPFHIIGGGSNLLVSDEGLRGVVVRFADENASLSEENGLIYAPSSLSKERFISGVIERGFGGVEFMAGIPGAVGGGIYMNAGTYMGSFSDILRKIKIADYCGNIKEIDVTCDLSGYREMKIPSGCAILGGYFSLPRTDSPESVRRSVDDIIADRWKKHPMEYPSAGSVFKNPEGYSSWKLINDSGLKGYAVGGAMISEKHTNFIINTGNALSSDIYRLVNHVRETVYSRFGVKLETEIRMMGDF